MAVLNVQDEFQSGDNVTATNLNNLVKDASFNADTTDNSTLEVHTSGYLKVKDAGVQTQHIGNDQVTYAKMQNVAANSVIGNPTSSSADPQAISISDLSSDIATELGNATTSADGLMSSTDKNKLDGIAANATANSGTVTSVSGNGGLTGSFTTTGSLSIATDGVTSDKISSTDDTFKVASDSVVINEIGGNVDFRVEGDGNPDLIVTQASNDTIGLGGAVDSGYRVAVDSGNLFPMFLKSTASAGGTGIVAHNTDTNSTGGVLQLGAPNQTSITTTANLDVSCLNNWILLGHNGSDICSVRLENSNTGSPTTASGAFFPGANGTQDLGKTGSRWNDLWSNGTFNGSDQNIKQDIEDLSEAEKRVAVKAKGLIKKYRMKDAVAKKGDQARIHVGIIAQELQAAFESEGLDAFRYSMIGRDTWWEKVDENGQRIVKDEATAGYTEVTQMSVRYNELLAFIITAL